MYLSRAKPPHHHHHHPAISFWFAQAVPCAAPALARAWQLFCCSYLALHYRISRRAADNPPSRCAALSSFLIITTTPLHILLTNELSASSITAPCLTRLAVINYPPANVRSLHFQSPEAACAITNCFEIAYNPTFLHKPLHNVRRTSEVQVDLQLP